MQCLSMTSSSPAGGPAEAGAHTASNLSSTLKPHPARMPDGLSKSQVHRPRMACDGFKFADGDLGNGLKKKKKKNHEKSFKMTVSND